VFLKGLQHEFSIVTEFQKSDRVILFQINDKKILIVNIRILTLKAVAKKNLIYNDLCNKNDSILRF